LILNADNITTIGRPTDDCCIWIYGIGIQNGLKINYHSLEERDKEFHKLSYLFSEL
jgi:hypothetical protein